MTCYSAPSFLDGFTDHEDELAPAQAGVCTDPACQHEGSGRGRYSDPCGWCARHDCDLDCNPPEHDDD